ncbi:hypothetical protein ACWC09_26870 [Streptomyces sp. NPDC001617]
MWITDVGLPNIGQGVGSTSVSDLSRVLNGYAIVFAALLVPAAPLSMITGPFALTWLIVVVLMIVRPARRQAHDDSATAVNPAHGTVGSQPAYGRSPGPASAGEGEPGRS